MIRDCRPSDAARICEIYNPHVRDTIVTFECTPVTENVMAERIQAIQQSYPCLVWEEGGVVGGYAYAGTWKPREAFLHTAETTIYLHPDFQRRGVGSRLYAALIARAREQGLHNLIAGISLPNPGSVALHEKAGFKKTGHFHEVGWKLGRWIDSGYWELLL